MFASEKYEQQVDAMDKKAEPAADEGMSRRDVLELLFGAGGASALLFASGCALPGFGSQTSASSAPAAESSASSTSQETAEPSAPALEVAEDELESVVESEILKMVGFASDPYLPDTIKESKLEGLSDIEEKVEGDQMMATFGATCTTGAVEAICRAKAYCKKGTDSWSLQILNILGCTFKAVSALKEDPLGRFSKGADIDFDEQQQTCTVAVTPDPAWYEEAGGTYRLKYRFGTDRWWYEGVDTSAATFSFKNLIGAYVKPDDPDFSENGYKLEIQDVADDGTVTAKLTCKEILNSFSFVSSDPDDRSWTATLTGRLCRIDLPSGGDCITATLAGMKDGSDEWVGWSIYSDATLEGKNSNVQVLKVAPNELNNGKKVTFQLEVPADAKVPTA